MSRTIQFSILILFLFIKTYSQDHYSTSVRENWNYFTLKGKKTVSIVDHIPAAALCGTLAFGSITIVRDDRGEVFRVLDLCNSKDYKINQSIEIFPSSKPKFNVLLPYNYYINEKTKEDLSDLGYDKTILNTTWVIIKENK
jgi:hypothetical protein